MSIAVDVPRVGLAAPADQELRGGVLAPLDLGLGNRRAASPRAACATIESAAAESRARSSRACSAEMSTSWRRPHFGPSVASPAWRSAITEPLGSCSSIRSAGGIPGSRLAVDEQAPDLLERVAADELLDVDAAVAERRSLAVRLGDLRLERDHAFEPGSKVAAHRGKR